MTRRGRPTTSRRKSVRGDESSGVFMRRTWLPLTLMLASACVWLPARPVAGQENISASDFLVGRGGQGGNAFGRGRRNQRPARAVGGGDEAHAKRAASDSGDHEDRHPAMVARGAFRRCRVQREPGERTKPGVREAGPGSDQQARRAGPGFHGDVHRVFADPGQGFDAGDEATARSDGDGPDAGDAGTGSRLCPRRPAVAQRRAVGAFQGGSEAGIPQHGPGGKEPAPVGGGRRSG